MTSSPPASAGALGSRIELRRARRAKRCSKSLSMLIVIVLNLKYGKRSYAGHRIGVGRAVADAPWHIGFG